MEKIVNGSKIINNSYSKFPDTYYTQKNNIYAPHLQNVKKLSNWDKSPMEKLGIITQF